MTLPRSTVALRMRRPPLGRPGNLLVRQGNRPSWRQPLASAGDRRSRAAPRMRVGALTGRCRSRALNERGDRPRGRWSQISLSSSVAHPATGHFLTEVEPGSSMSRLHRRGGLKWRSGSIAKRLERGQDDGRGNDDDCVAHDLVAAKPPGVVTIQASLCPCPPLLAPSGLAGVTVEVCPPGGHPRTWSPDCSAESALLGLPPGRPRLRQSEWRQAARRAPRRLVWSGC